MPNFSKEGTALVDDFGFVEDRHEESLAIAGW